MPSDAIMDSAAPAEGLTLCAEARPSVQTVVGLACNDRTVTVRRDGTREELSEQCSTGVLNAFRSSEGPGAAGTQTHDAAAAQRLSGCQERPLRLLRAVTARYARPSLSLARAQHRTTR
eukprot:764823-Hanusia_phi.AAC.2